jgi:uncharacterized protein
MMKKQIKILIGCALAVVITGCASSSPSHFYTLAPVTGPAAGSPADYSVSVGPISVPAIVDRNQIVVLAGPNQVAIDDFNRWASPLKDDIGRVIMENLVFLLGTNLVSLFPQTAADGAAYRAGVHVLRFDSELGKSATLDALWTVNSAKGKQSYRGRTTVTEATQGGDYAALVAAHSRALGRLSADIAKKIQEMETQKH